MEFAQTAVVLRYPRQLMTPALPHGGAGFFVSAFRGTSL